MSLFTIIGILIIVGVLLYLINNYLPIDAKIKKIINIVAIGGVVFWLLKIFGILNYLSNITI